MAGDVMIPIDGSPASASVLPTALRVAATFGTGVQVVRVFDVARDVITPRVGMLDVSAAEDELREAAERELEQVTGRVRSVGIPAGSALLEGDDVARTLLDHARRTDAAAIVMLTTAKGAMARATLGSVSDRVMREAGLPVVLVPPVTGDQPAAAVAADRPLHHVLVPVDGTAESLRVAEHLTTLPRPLGLVLTLFRAIDPATLTGTALPARADGGASLEGHMRAEHETLDAVARRLAADGLSARAMTVETTDTADAISAAARAEGADLIAMSTRGRGGLSRYAHGSTADAVVRRATVPVLLLSGASGAARGDAN